MFKKKHTSATELADLSVCETKVVLDRKLTNRFIKKHSEKQKKSIRIGNKKHEQHHKNVTRHYKEDKRCFIATATFGNEHPITASFRLFRDEKLEKSKAGKIFIKIYYATSPALATIIDKSPSIKKISQYALIFIHKKIT